MVGPVSVWPGRIMRLLSQDRSYYTSAKGPTVRAKGKGRSAGRRQFIQYLPIETHHQRMKAKGWMDYIASKREAFIRQKCLCFAPGVPVSPAQCQAPYSRRQLDSKLRRRNLEMMGKAGPGVWPVLGPT